MPDGKGLGNHYERLGVAPEASDEELKRAYCRAVRNHPPEADPEGFRRIREAWETLKDPRSRSQYDALLRHGGEIQRLFEAAQAAEEAEDFQEAGRLLKRILVLSPDMEAARVRLAFGHLRQEDWDQAIRQFDHLVREGAESEHHCHWAAQARFLQAIQEATPEARSEKLFKEAMELYRRASRLEPANAEPHLGMARIHRHQGRLDEALVCVERAVGADGRVDFQDFEALHLACLIHLDREDPAGFEQTLRRIGGLSAEAESIKYVGWHFAESALRAARAGAFVPAGRLAAAALEFAPDEPWMREMAEDFKQLAEVAREFERVPEDEEFLKIMLALELQLCVASEEEREPLQARWNETVGLLPRIKPEVLLKWSAILKKSCPTFYRRNQELVDQMEALGARLAPILAEGDRACQDPQLPEVLRGVAGLMRCMAADPLGEHKEEHVQGIGKAFETVPTWPPAEIRAGLTRLRTRYPALCASYEPFLGDLEKVVGTKYVEPAADNSGWCGCLFLVGIAGLLMALIGGCG
jgi:curved DNA-binding protein CbpA